MELAEKVRELTAYAKDHDVTIAVVGCRVNGPGETDDAERWRNVLSFASRQPDAFPALRDALGPGGWSAAHVNYPEPAHIAILAELESRSHPGRARWTGTPTVERKRAGPPSGA